MRPALLSCWASAVALASLGSAWANSSGGPPMTTGGPFPGETLCTRCHQGSEANSGAGTLALLIEGNPASEYAYTPGETVSMIVEFSDPDAARVGFQLTVRSDDGCGQPGSLAAGSSTAGSRVRVVAGDCSSSANEVAWATHRRPQNGSSARFEVAWTAPAESAGPVTVAVAVNGANGDASLQGDKIYSLQTTLQHSVAPTDPPTISSGRVILADLFSGTTTGAPGAIASASGTDFTSQGTNATGTLDVEGRLATVLDGSCLEVNSKRAPLFQVTAERVTFQIPHSAGLGDSTVQFLRGCDSADAVRSNAAAFDIAAVQPVFFLFTDDPPAIAALHTDMALVGEEGAIPGRESRPAVAGDVVTLFGTGFGLVAPHLATGEFAWEAAPVATPSVRALIGEIEVPQENILYAGAAPSAAGLYQLSVQVPDNVAAGTHGFTLMLDGVSSPSGPKLTVAVPEAEPAEIVPCEVDMVVGPGGSCKASVAGNEAILTVDEEGQACIAVLGFNLCGNTASEINARITVYGGQLAKNADGTWTIVKLP